MIGVSNPTSDHTIRKWIDFLAGYAIGSALSSVLIIALVTALHLIIEQLIPRDIRYFAASLIAVLLATMDARGRTLCRRRQTPQRLSYSLSQGWLGVVYGIDVGSFVTTYKVTSMIWFVGVASLLIDSAWIVPAVLIAWVVGILSLFLRHNRAAMRTLMSFQFVDQARRVGRFTSALALLGLSIAMVGMT